jgi:hypothetical protein
MRSVLRNDGVCCDYDCFRLTIFEMMHYKIMHSFFACMILYCLFILWGREGIEYESVALIYFQFSLSNFHLNTLQITKRLSCIVDKTIYSRSWQPPSILVCLSSSTSLLRLRFAPPFPSQILPSKFSLLKFSLLTSPSP